MDKMTPGELGMIVTMVMGVIFGRMLWDWRWPIVEAWIKRRRYVTSDTADNSDDAISRHQDAVKENAENAENGKPLGPTPAELDRMIAQARYEALARAVGTLAGRGIIPAERRSAALLAVGIEGRRYTSLKPLVDAAQAAAQAEQPQAPPEPPRVTPLAGRPVPPGIRFSDELNEALGEE